MHVLRIGLCNSMHVLGPFEMANLLFSELSHHILHLLKHAFLMFLVGVGVGTRIIK